MTRRDDSRRSTLTIILKKPSLRSVTLDQVEVGGSAVVRRVSQRSSLTLRLMEMGLVSGAAVKVRKKAPFGGPMELDVGGYRLSIRTGDASVFEVERA